MKGIKKIKVACMGDSITELSGYPNHAQQTLGSNYVVSNFGVCGTTVSLDSEYPYMYQKAFVETKSFQPNIAVVMLGTNDANIAFKEYRGSFIDDYIRLLSAIQAFESKPKVLIVKPPHVFDEVWISGRVFDNKIIPAIEKTARQANLPIVDVYSAADKLVYFFDGVHPNGEGAQIIANVLCKAIMLL
jgi:acyl-CoA thioesterase I